MWMVRMSQRVIDDDYGSKYDVGSTLWQVGVVLAFGNDEKSLVMC